MTKEVPIAEKYNLTLEEAALYFGIGINRIRDLSNEPGCDFVLRVGTKRLIKKKKMERFLDEKMVL